MSQLSHNLEGLGFSPRKCDWSFSARVPAGGSLPWVLRTEGFIYVLLKDHLQGSSNPGLSLAGEEGVEFMIPSLLLYFACLLHPSELSYMQISGLWLIQKKCITHHHIFKNCPPFFPLNDNGKCSDANFSDPHHLPELEADGVRATGKAGSS